MSQAVSRGLTPLLLPAARASAGSEALIFWVTLAAILSQLSISATVMLWAGIPYNAPGGPPPVKLHIGTYLAVLAVVLQVRQHRPIWPHFVARIARSPLFPLATLLMLGCAGYALFTLGMSGTAVYLESYAAAGVLGFALEGQSPANLRRIGYAILAAFTVNAALCIGETLLQHRLVPMMMTNVSGEVYVLPEFANEFRGTALYSHPLTGAMMTMMGVLLCLAVTLRPLLKALIIGTLLVALIAFGGRTATAVTFALLATLGAGDVLRRLLQRRADSRYLALTLTLLVVVPLLLAAILFATPLGVRMAGKFYADDSATVRVVQWAILSRMDPRDWLFGMDAQRLDTLMVLVGLHLPYNDIENFWLLVFLSLGLVGFPLWLCGLGTMLWRLWRDSGLYCRLMLLSVLLVASSSNSLGRKSNILFICVAAMMSGAAFSRRPPGVPPALPAIATRTSMRVAPCLHAPSRNPVA